MCMRPSRCSPPSKRRNRSRQCQPQARLKRRPLPSQQQTQRTVVPVTSRCWSPWLRIQDAWTWMTRVIGITMDIPPVSSSCDGCASNLGLQTCRSRRCEHGSSLRCWRVPSRRPSLRQIPRYPPLTICPPGMLHSVCATTLCTTAVLLCGSCMSPASLPC